MEYILSWWSLGGLLVIAGGLGFFFWPAILTFLSTPLGRKLAAIGALVLAAWITLIKVFNAGKRAELDRLKANSQRLEEQRDKRDAELKALPADDLVKRGDKWVRD